MSVFAETTPQLSEASSSVWDFFADGGLFMLFLVLLSVLSVAVIIYKALALRRETVMPQDVSAELERAEVWAEQGNLSALGEMMRHSPSTLSRIGIFAMTSHAQDRDEARQNVQANAREEVVQLETGIALLEVVIAVAPLTGLLGTVSGLVGVFSNLDAAGGEHARIAGGIAEALNTTIAGLAVAVPTVFAHSYFSKKIEKMAVRMEVLIGHLVNVLYRPLSHGPGEEVVAAAADVGSPQAEEAEVESAPAEAPLEVPVEIEEPTETVTEEVGAAEEENIVDPRTWSEAPAREV